MENNFLFVQFLHPGKEHSIDKQSSPPPPPPKISKIKSWNKGSHKRKFIINKGSYLNSATSSTINSDIAFWGEWEPESEFEIIENPQVGYPNYFHHPFYVIPDNFNSLKNTDPFVFGDNFLYSCCQQIKALKPGRLRDLKKGSIILFGSNTKEGFALDTVFVVSEKSFLYNENNFQDLKKHVSNTFFDVTIKPIYSDIVSDCNPSCGKCIKTPPQNKCIPDNISLRLYFGANFKNPVNGMFSFFPCIPYENGSIGFKKPIINMDEISSITKLGVKYTYLKDFNHGKGLWDKVVNQVVNAGLCLGVYAELPIIK